MLHKFGLILVQMFQFHPCIWMQDLSPLFNVINHNFISTELKITLTIKEKNQIQIAEFLSNFCEFSSKLQIISDFTYLGLLKN